MGKPKRRKPPNKNRRQNNPTALPETQQTNSINAPGPNPVTHLPPQPDTSSPKSEPIKKKWYQTMQGWKTLLEIIAIPFAIFYAIVTYFEWRDSHNNFVADQRSWIIPAYGWPELRSDVPAVIRMKMMNSGKSLILRLIAEGTFEVVDSDKAPSFILPPAHSKSLHVELFPGMENEFPIVVSDQESKKDRHFTEAEIENLIVGKSYLVGFGMLRFRDPFGKHWVRFCTWHSFATISTSHAGTCVAWNAIGEGEPSAKDYSAGQALPISMSDW